MITIPTVFVLGAGASRHFGFPVGLQLAEQVQDIGQGGSFTQSLNDIRFSDAAIQEFRMALSRSGLMSVDGFLEARSEFMDIGKAVIAQFLIPWEREENLFRHDNKNWLRQLYGTMHSKPEDFGKNAVSFITFNYDRTVEHFFITSLMNSHALSETDAAVILQRIPIVHLHGRLGYLPWQKMEGARPLRSHN